MVGGGRGGAEVKHGVKRRFQSGRSQAMGYCLRENPKKSRRMFKEDEEIQDLAMCLILLSRDTSDVVVVAAAAAAAVDATDESSDKNSAVVEENGVEVPVWDVKKRKSQSNHSWIGTNGNVGSKSKNRKRSAEDAGSDELGKSVMVISTKKSRRFQCETCKRNFSSYQALGGHRASNRRTKGCSPPLENSSETEIFSPPADVANANYAAGFQELGIQITHTSFDSPKKKEHSYTCPICFRIFSSGQALGGHKRAHIVASSRSGYQDQQAEKVVELLDLNTSALADNNSSITNGHASPVVWSAGSRYKHGFLFSG